jgi:hypothetical protein
VALLPLAGCETILNALGSGVMLADLVVVEADGAGGWVDQGTGVTANVIVPTELVTEKFTETSEHCLVFEGVTLWQTHPGSASMTLSSSLQSATATLDGDRYVIGGLTASAAFAAEDELVVAAGSTEVRVPAPPPHGDLAEHFGPPGGLATVFRAPAGELDVVTVFVTATSPYPGEAGIMCRYPAAALATEGAFLSGPLVDASTIATAGTRGLVPGLVFVGYFREVQDDTLFQGRTTYVQAGRMFRVAAADLD